MKVRLLLLSILFLSVLTGCKKDPTYEGGNGGSPDAPSHYEGDLSYKRYLEKYYVGMGGTNLREYKHVYQYEGNKEIGYQKFRDGALIIECKNYIYSGLSRTNIFRSQLSSGYYESEWYEEFLDDSFIQPIYTETREGGVVISKTIYEYNGNNCMGIKQYSNDILTEESTNYLWEEKNQVIESISII